MTASKRQRTDRRIRGDATEAIRRDPPRNMNLAEAAAYIGISPRKLRDDVRVKRISVIRLGGRLIFRLEDIDRALARLKV